MSMNAYLDINIHVKFATIVKVRKFYLSSFYVIMLRIVLKGSNLSFLQHTKDFCCLASLFSILIIFSDKIFCHYVVQ